MAFNTVTLATILIGFGKFTNLLFLPRGQYAGTVDTTGTTAILKDTELNVFLDDKFNDVYWVYVTSGNALGNVRNISDFTQTGGFVTPAIAFTGAPVSPDAYQIWKADPYYVVEALNRALESIYDKLWKPIIFESLGYDSLKSNANSSQKVVAVNDATRFWVRQVCTISDDDASESCTVSSISSNDITMTANLSNSYTTAKSAVLYGQSGRYWRLPSTIGQAPVTRIFRRDDSPSTGSPPSARKMHTEWNIIHSSNGERLIYFPISKSVNDQTWIVEAKHQLESVTLGTPTGAVTIDNERLPLLYCRAAYHYYNDRANEVVGVDRKRLIGISREYRDREKRDYRDLYMPIDQEIADITTDSDYDHATSADQSTVRW